MAYRLVISPTAKRSLYEIVDKYRDPGLLQAVQQRMDRLAEDPVRYGDQNPTVHGRPWVLVKYEASSVRLYFQVAYRFLPGEQDIEILDIKSLRF